MPERVRVGVIGTSWFADLVHLPFLKSHPGAVITAICGRRRERAEEVARKYGIPTVFTDYSEMIERAELDAVVVVTPDDMHYPMTMAALDAGLHVLCEKPLALTADLARSMYERAESAGVKHMTYFTYRWLPHYRYLRELIEEGYLGRCFHAHFHYLAGGGRGVTEYAWRYDGKRANGALGDLGSHMIDLARWCLGEITEVSANLEVFCPRPAEQGKGTDAANDSAVLAVRFEGGAQGVIHASNVAHVGEKGQVHSLALHGDAGTLEAEFSFVGSRIRGARQGEGSLRVLPVPEGLSGGADPAADTLSQFVQVFTTQSVGDRLFIDAILEDHEVVPSFREGWKAQEAIDGAKESHRDGRWVNVG